VIASQNIIRTAAFLPSGVVITGAVERPGAAPAAQGSSTVGRTWQSAGFAACVEKTGRKQRSNYSNLFCVKDHVNTQSRNVWRSQVSGCA
jgi:hypothetical protein